MCNGIIITGLTSCAMMGWKLSVYSLGPRPDGMQLVKSTSRYKVAASDGLSQRWASGMYATWPPLWLRDE